MVQEVLFSPACERNKDVILQHILKYASSLSPSLEKKFLELGFGTGQHAYHFAKALPHFEFTLADREEYHSPFLVKREQEGCPQNIKGPFLFQANESGVEHSLPFQNFNYLYMANVFHIMSWEEAKETLKALPSLLGEKGIVFLYGPFKFEGRFTSDSNAAFDEHLKESVAYRGIRDFEAIEELLKEGGLIFEKRWDLPANNQFLVFKKQ